MRTTGWACIALLWGAPAAADDGGRIAVQLGYAGLAGPAAPTGSGASVGGSGAGYLSFQLTDTLALDVGGREGVTSGDLRVVGAVQVAARGTLGRAAYVRGGFVHHHETPWDAFRQDALLSALGSGEGIRHRSGADVGFGLSWDLPSASAPVSTSVEVSVIGFPDNRGPQVYGVVQHLFSIGLGKRPEAT